jgi:hypothetical protein
VLLVAERRIVTLIPEISAAKSGWSGRALDAMSSPPSAAVAVPPQFRHENITVSPRMIGKARAVVIASRE